MHTIEEVIKKAAGLPEDLQKEVADFVEFLSQRLARPYTSVGLQHKASEGRANAALGRRSAISDEPPVARDRPATESRHACHGVMINQHDRDTITRLAREYKVSKVILFGSSIAEGRESHDIDLGVKGIDPLLFFRFYGDLMQHLSKPVDLIDLAQRTLFTELVEETGVAIYG